MTSEANRPAAENGGRPAFRALLLDFAGVLTVDVLGTHRRWCEANGLPPEAWRAALNDDPEGRELYRQLEIGELSQADWNRAMAPKVGIGDGGDDLMGRAWAGVRADADMIRLAMDARAAGLTVALLSNSFGLDPYNPYRELGLWDLFDVHVISEVEGIAKPDPRFYVRALDLLGLPGDACLFVDDHPRNLPPAQALGITTVLADGNAADNHADTAAAVAALLGLCTAPVA